MSRLNELIGQVAKSDPQLAKDLRQEADALADRRAFGLNFERHTPEAVELPGRPVRKNDKVRVLPERGKMPKQGNEILYRVTNVYTEAGKRSADVQSLDDPEDSRSIPADELVVVAEFRDPIYPGLVSTGKVERGGDKPFHTVINAENYHALQALLFTHRGKVDAIYIDPPYNTGAKDWKYNNDYVESDDHYRHSKWLAFMERRLLLAKELLDPDDSVLIVTIDEKECLRLGLLLEQVFPESDLQMITTLTNPMGSRRGAQFSRVEEYAFVVFVGAAEATDSTVDMLGRQRAVSNEGSPVRWTPLNRDGNGWERAARPNMFYPLFVDPSSKRIVQVGDSLALADERGKVSVPDGLIAVWPFKGSEEARWQVGRETAETLIDKGLVTVTSINAAAGSAVVRYLTSGAQAKIESGEYRVTGTREDGSLVVVSSGEVGMRPGTTWTLPSHSARDHGTALISKLIPDRKFPFPKSLFLVEDTLRFFLRYKRDATVVDFFAGSGTTAHAVMRLNRQDGGHRVSISITNNEVSADEQKGLREQGRRPGDADWEKLGICEYITQPRIQAAITGRSPDNKPIVGDYKFTDEFPMADGFEENVEFFRLTYESAMRVSSNREFAKISPFLWLRAGAKGRRVDDISQGWDVADAYGVIANLDLSDPFATAVEAQEGLTHAFVVTDEDRLFEAMVRQLPAHVEPVRLYSSYLRNFEIEAVRGAR